MSLLPTQPNFIVIKLGSKADISKALRAIKERKIVIVNLINLDFQQAQRAVDCLSGCTCAIEGTTYWLGEKTYLFLPRGVELKAKSQQN